MTQPIQSSQRAILLMVTEEDGDANYYIRFEAGFSWPGGASGPTFGIGYDGGYSTAEQIEQDWSPFVDAARVAILKTAAGLTGSRAQAFVAEHRHAIAITWDEALAQFKGHELPKWEDITRAHLPNCDKLSGDSFGALASLTYNRGPSYDSPGDRCLEMRNIKAHMAAEQFGLIPNEFMSMRRLWPRNGDLWNRRGHEAILFRDGLPTPPTAVAAPVPSTPDRSAEALQAALNKLGASPPLAVDGSVGQGTRTAVRAFQAANGLAVDGLAGAATWAAIDAKLSPPEPGGENR